MPMPGSSNLGSKQMAKSKPDHGIPEHVIELMGPPPVLPRRVDQFYRMLRALASETVPRGMSDWLLLWDMAVARIDLSQIGAAKLVAMRLLHDQAAIEIVRRDSLRFIGQPPSESIGRDFDPEVGIFESGPPAVDMVATRLVLKRLGLDESSVDDLAYLMAFSMLTPLEILASAKQGVERTSRNEIDRRHARQDQSETMRGSGEILDAEFSPATKTSEEPVGLDSSPSSARRRKLASAPPHTKSITIETADCAGKPAVAGEVNDNAGVA